MRNTILKPDESRAMPQAARATDAPHRAEFHRLGHSVGIAIAHGHRTYLDNPRLITTRTHRGVPLARGHRRFL
jgi:hypothetical protein